MKFLNKSVVIASILVSITNAGAQGLKFSGLETRIDDRTSFNVFGSRRHSFRDSLSISFSLCTYPESEFGYILRIKEKKGKIWNLSYDGHGDTCIFRLNEEGRHSLIQASIPRSEMKHLHWSDVAMIFIPGKDSVFFKMAGHRFAGYCDHIPRTLVPEIEFGKSEYIIDVPTFAIRDLRIKGNGQNFSFPLDESEGESVHSGKHKKTGIVSNPKWLVRDAMFWQKTGDAQLPSNAASCFCPGRNEIWYFDKNKAIIFDTERKTVTERGYASPCPLEIKTGACHYDDARDEIVAYEPFDERQDEGSVMSASLSCETMEWVKTGTGHLDFPVYHHTSFTNPENGMLTIFGGFGDMLYNGHFYSMDKEGNWIRIWDKDGSTLYPRYFTSSGINPSDGHIYIFGGMGNECGEQIVGRKYYYDLHRVNPADGTITKMWELRRDKEDEVPVRTLVMEDGYFYTLCYPEYKSNSELTLYRFSLKDGSTVKHSDTVPIVSDKMNTNAALYYDKEQKKLFAVTQVSDDDIRSTLSIYELSFPPVMQENSSEENRSGILKIFLLVLALTVILTASAIVYSRKKRWRSISEMYVLSKNNPENGKYSRKETKNGIYLFGDLSVIDRNGNDLGERMSEQQKMIFLLLVKYSLDGGLSTRRLSSLIWPDKEEDKVKNSRGVAINTLRKTLSTVDGLSIDFNDGHYRLVTNGCHCDYFRLDELIKENSECSDEILGIFSRGRFLHDTDDPLFDSFKEDVDNLVVPILSAQLQQHFKESDYLGVIEIADIAFRTDPLDETALRYQIKALLKIKRREDALLKFSTFAAEYRKVNGEDYPDTFDKL